MDYRPSIEDAIRNAAGGPERTSTIELHGYVKVRCLFENGAAVIQILDSDGHHSIVAENASLLAHMVNEIVAVALPALRERQLKVLQAQACRLYEYERHCEHLESELRTATRLLRMSEEVRAVLQHQLERHESDEKIGALTLKAKDRVKGRHPELF